MHNNANASLLVSLAAVTALSSVVATETHSRARFVSETIWRVSVGGPARPETIYRLAACHDGSSYFVESSGRVVSLTPQGQAAEAHLPEAVGAVAAVCGSDRALTVATGQEVVRFARAGTSFLTTTRARVSVLSLAATHDHIVGLGSDALARAVIWQIPGSESLESVPIRLARLDWDPTQLSMGQIIWNPQRSAIGVVPGGRYELHEYSPDGRLLAVKFRDDPSFRLPAAPRLFGPGLPAAQVRFIHPLAEDRYVALVVRSEEKDVSTVRFRNSVEILDNRLQLIGVVENGTELGIPQGVAESGDLLVMGVNPLGSWVSRTRLRPREGARLSAGSAERGRPSLERFGSRATRLMGPRTSFTRERDARREHPTPSPPTLLDHVGGHSACVFERLSRSRSSRHPLAPST